MELLTPGIGLIFWQAVVFLLLLFLLSKLAWRPILNALKIREESIQEALSAAEEARKEMENLRSDNEKLLNEARQEREKILKQAREIANSIKEEAKNEALKISEKLMADTRTTIEAEKKAALADVRNQVTELSLAITEKIIKKQLEADKEQRQLIDEYMKELKLN